MNNDIIEPEMTFSDELRFTPYAWAKLIYMRDKGKTEVAGYGITETKDPLLITNFILIKQECTSVSFDFNPEDGVEYMERMMDKGLMPWQYSNILIHTHPGDSPNPSGTDEDNFKGAFTHPHWAIMVIVADSGKTYCRLKLNVGPGVTKKLRVSIEYNVYFSGTDIESWEEEYKSNVTEINFLMTGIENIKQYDHTHFSNQDDPMWWDEEKQEFIPLNETEQEFHNNAKYTDLSLEELEDLDCCWDSDGNVCYWGEGECHVYDPVKEKWYTDDSNNETNEIEIEEPKQLWAKKVIAWANHFANDRVVLMEN